MPARKIKGVPPLKVSPRIKPPNRFDPSKTSIFHYESKAHKQLPHVVKFSGGKTSGMLLFILLEADMLKAERGDVIIFNNTSAEHPHTYEFVKQCKEVVERQYKIPFFLIEYQTYEDARQGEYVRIPSFRLVNTNPYDRESNPDGYHFKGEVFEELLSQQGYVPTLFQRTCTKSMKLECSRFFLREWLANKEMTERLGHYGQATRLDDDEMYARHIRNQGGVPFPIFKKKKEFLKQCRLAREAQKWSDFSKVVIPFSNKRLDGKAYGRKAHFGRGGIEYLSFMGLRFDEMHRVVKVQNRNLNLAATDGYEGEHVYMPLADMQITDENVQEFWSEQTWELKLNQDDNLSNCTFCFLKGVEKLGRANEALIPIGNEYAGTPCDINWWIDIEEKYGRDMIKEERKVKREVTDDFIGFFGVSSNLTYRKLRDTGFKKEAAMLEEVLPCDCTD